MLYDKYRRHIKLLVDFDVKLKKKEKKKKTPAWHILTCNPESQFLRINHSQIYCKFKKQRPPFLRAYFLANEIFIAFVCVILKPCSASRAAPACTSFSNSTNAMSWRPGTRRTSLKPGNLKRTHQQLGSAYNRHKRAKLDLENGFATDWLKSMDSMSSLVSSGKLVRKRMWLGGFSATYEYTLDIRFNQPEKYQFIKLNEDTTCSVTKHYLLGHLSRHLPRHHLTRRNGTRGHLARCHPWRWHHAWRGHVRWLARHVHHTGSLAHWRHSLKSEELVNRKPDVHFPLLRCVCYYLHLSMKIGSVFNHTNCSKCRRNFLPLLLFPYLLILFLKGSSQFSIMFFVLQLELKTCFSHKNNFIDNKRKFICLTQLICHL